MRSNSRLAAGVEQSGPRVDGAGRSSRSSRKPRFQFGDVVGEIGVSCTCYLDGQVENVCPM